jgi:hypothetical protein
MRRFYLRDYKSIVLQLWQFGELIATWLESIIAGLLERVRACGKSVVWPDLFSTAGQASCKRTISPPSQDFLKKALTHLSVLPVTTQAIEISIPSDQQLAIDPP